MANLQNSSKEPMSAGEFHSLASTHPHVGCDKQRPTDNSYRAETRRKLEIGPTVYIKPTPERL